MINTAIIISIANIITFYVIYNYILSTKPKLLVNEKKEIHCFRTIISSQLLTALVMGSITFIYTKATGKQITDINTAISAAATAPVTPVTPVTSVTPVSPVPEL